MSPASPSSAAAAKIHRGFNRVVYVTMAVTRVTATATKLCAATHVTTKALAAIRPIEIGSSPAWIAARQGASLKRSHAWPT